MKRQIEDYLRARGARYFRGHHDDEYFFLIDFVSGAYRGRLHVHLEVCDAQPGEVLVTISPDRYYPADKADLLRRAADRWNAAEPAVTAVLHGSSDPGLVGVRADARIRAAEPAILTTHVEAALAAAIHLFGRLAATASPESVAALRHAV